MNSARPSSFTGASWISTADSSEVAGRAFVCCATAHVNGRMVINPNSAFGRMAILLLLVEIENTFASVGSGAEVQHVLGAIIMLDGGHSCFDGTSAEAGISASEFFPPQNPRLHLALD